MDDSTLDTEDEPWLDYRYGDDDLALWRERCTRVWSLYERGVRDMSTLIGHFEPDEAHRFAMSLNMAKAATSGFESEIQWLFGAAAIAGVVPPIPSIAPTPEEVVELGRFFVQAAADDSIGEGWPWEPAVAYLEQHPEE